MIFQKFYQKGFGALFLVLFALAVAGFAQTPTPTPTLVVPRLSRDLPVASGNNLYCAGYVESGTVRTGNKIVGAENEQEQFVYGQGNNLYINIGANRGVKVGDMFSVIRPRGQVETRWTKKKRLGFYVQEVGALEVVKVKDKVSVVRVKSSCDNLLLGDLVQPVQERTSPRFEQRPTLDKFGEPTGKASGRIFMARDGIEMIGREQIVYIDLGAEDNVSVGDYLTVYRPLGQGNPLNERRLFNLGNNESVSARDEGFESEVYRGGKFSNQAGRKRGNDATSIVETTRHAKEDRPANLRKVVGEIVILNVKGKTATALVTRTAQEIHTGDRVELQ